MSVYLDETEIDFTIRIENQAEAYAAALKLIQSGGYEPWDDPDYTDLPSLLSACCWVPDVLKEIPKHIKYSHPPKIGDIVGLEAPENFDDKDILLWNALAPYVEEGSYININTSDFQHFQWYFDGKNCIRKNGTMDYDCNIEIVEALLTNQKDLPMLLNIHPELDKRIHEILKDDCTK